MRDMDKEQQNTLKNKEPQNKRDKDKDQHIAWKNKEAQIKFDLLQKVKGAHDSKLNMTEWIKMKQEKIIKKKCL